MSKNGAKKGVTLYLQAKKGLELLKIRSSTDTKDIKVESWDDREGAKGLEQERFKWVIYKEK